ncbi:MAG TPA: hypothetical protein VKU93_09150 [Terracidiphilus sp.]|nr:hypothetical protein [Terracidiphilus sp.]
MRNKSAAGEIHEQRDIVWPLNGWGFPSGPTQPHGWNQMALAREQLLAQSRRFALRQTD